MKYGKDFAQRRGASGEERRDLPMMVWMAAMLTMSACGSHSTGIAVRFALQPPSTNNYPSHLAQWLGFYKEEGLEVTISQIAGASKVLEALVGGSADVGGGVYEQTIQMAAEGREVVSFVSLSRSPNFALVAAPGLGVKTVADLRGKMVGVSSVGSPSQFYLNYLLAGAGISPGDVSTASIGQAATAMTAVERKQVAAGVLFGSSIPALEARQPGVVRLADVRTPEGLKTVFGVDDYPASSLLATRAWLQANPDTARRMGRAVLKSLAWIRDHSPEEILAKVPAESRVGDPVAEIEAIRLAKPMYSLDGRIKLESAAAVRRVLAGSIEQVNHGQIDLSRTYTNEFLP